MPNGSMLKYFQDIGGPGTEHGGKLHWPGTPEGFPFRGSQIPNLRGEEADDLPLALDYKSESFQLWDPDQKQRFDLIMDRIVNGWYMLYKRRDEWSQQHEALVVWLEWVQIYGETPAGKIPRSGFDDAESAVFPLGPAQSP